MPTRVQYDGKRLIPAPYVSVQKNYNRAGDGSIVGKSYQIVIRGFICADRGSPDTTGTFWTLGDYPPNETITADSRLAALIRKQEAIRELFSQDYKSLEIQSADGSQPMKFFPRVVSVDIPEGLWYDKLEYTITLEADKMFPETDTTLDSGYNLESASESWTLDTDESNPESDTARTYMLKHSVSAVGKPLYDENGVLQQAAWEVAKAFVVSRLGYDTSIEASTDVNNIPAGYNGYNTIRNETTDKKNGSYSVDESWVLATGPAIESFNVSVEESLEQTYPTVTIDGQITGFEERDTDMSLLTSKWDNAQDKFTTAYAAAHTRAQNISGLTLNTIPLSYTKGVNQYGGTIQYSLKYDTRPSRLIPGTKSETVTISDNNRGDVFAAIFCIGREAGPVLQYLGAKTEATKALNIEIVVPVPTYADTTVATLKSMFYNKKPSEDPTYSTYINNIIEAANPANNGYTQCYSSSPQETWDFLTGRYSYSVTWTYE